MEEEMLKLKREVDHYRQKFATAEYDVAVAGYLAYVNLVRQQVEFITKFKVSENIDGKKAETVLYDRAIAMGESLPKNILSMNNLKSELRIEFDQNEGKEKAKAISPQSIGK
jgi:hypothetical protein